MPRLLILGFTISLDGYGAGPDQSLENPLGVGGELLHDWLVGTRTFMRMQGKADGGEVGIDEDLAARSMNGIGAWILGRNMFGPVRGAWPDESWRGWWGKNPPYHAPAFVLTHHPRLPLEMEGGTVFHFVTDGIQAALERARAAAGEKDIRLLGGVATIRQYLRARLVDEMHVAVSPIVLGSGEHLLTGIDLTMLGYKVEKCVPSAKAVHYVIGKIQYRSTRSLPTRIEMNSQPVLNYHRPAPRLRREPYWIVFIPACALGLMIARVLDQSIKMHLTGFPADGGVTGMASMAIVPAIIVAFVLKRRWWLALIIGASCTPLAVVGIRYL